MDSKDKQLLLYHWRPSWIWPKKRVKGFEKFEPYDFLVIWSLMMKYPPLAQFGQTNLANSIFVTSQPPLFWGNDVKKEVNELLETNFAVYGLIFVWQIGTGPHLGCFTFIQNQVGRVNHSILQSSFAMDIQGPDSIWRCHLINKRKMASLYWFSPLQIDMRYDANRDVTAKVD